MELWFFEMVMKGGPAAFVLGIGLLWLNPKINTLQKSVDELKSGKRWTETCEETHKEVDRRIGRLEGFANGSLKK
jgi:hypothetical protein